MGINFHQKTIKSPCLSCGKEALNDLYCLSCDSDFFEKLKKTKPKIDNSEIKKVIREKERKNREKKSIKKEKITCF